MSIPLEEQVLYKHIDWSSFSNPSEVVSTNIRLEWHLDFDNHVIFGAVEHVMKVVTAKATEIFFDSSDITITGDVLVNNEVAAFSQADKHPVLGTKITVEIPEAYRFEGASFTVLFQYSISPEASAVQWLQAAATKGGKHPYIFTQSQAIHARSLLPCMDSPGVKTPYSAVITAPKWCTVLMSALADSTENITSRLSTFPIPEDSNKFHWTQPVPTPAYLIALAGGNLVSKDISERVRVWSEPEVIESAHFEFGETEEFVQAAEAITGCPYQWRRYDVLCLPPSFPYGGMENPCLTFATPTLLAGDRSLADVIAHEIAHSWTGNLVTNLTWDHFWLNEGWTVWLERKITSKVKDNDEVGRLSAQIGYKHLLDDVKRMGVDDPFTCAVWPLNGQDPDDAFSSVPYEKGFNILMYLETMVGRDVFEAFAQVYIDRFKFSTVTTGAFRDCFVDFINKVYADSNSPSSPVRDAGKKNKGKKGKGKTAAPAGVLSISQAAYKQVQGVKWVELFCSTGMPRHVPDYSNSLSDTAVKLARVWIENMDNVSSVQASQEDMKGWSSHQIQIFLEEFINHALPEGTNYSIELLSKMDAAYSFTSSHNAEIMFRWQTLCLRSNMESILPYVVSFVTSQGRMKFIRPLYRAMGMSNIGGKLALETFQKFKDTYHPIARKMVESDLIKIAALHKEEEEEDDEEGYETTGAASMATVSNDFEDVRTGNTNGHSPEVDEIPAEMPALSPPTPPVASPPLVEPEAQKVVSSPDPLWNPTPSTAEVPPVTPVKMNALSSPSTPFASFQTPSGSAPASNTKVAATESSPVRVQEEVKEVVRSSAPPASSPSLPSTTTNHAVIADISIAPSSTGETSAAVPASPTPAPTPAPVASPVKAAAPVASPVKAAAPAPAPAPAPVKAAAPAPASAARKEEKPESTSSKTKKPNEEVVKKSSFVQSPTFFALMALGLSFGAFFFLRSRLRK